MNKNTQKDSSPNFFHEENIYSISTGLVAGVDEAGRGCLAGPVVAAAVILDPNQIPEGLNDSKKLTQKKRELLFDKIIKTGTVSWSSMPALCIDKLNIRQATLVAMKKAIISLSQKPLYVLVDGLDAPTVVGIDVKSLVKGDRSSLSIAAASVVAKVVRDQIMCKAALTYPNFGFEFHKGYGTAAHLAALQKYNPCQLHRKSFKPVKNSILLN